MITQVLSRSFVLDQLKRVQAVLAEPAKPARRGAAPQSDVPAEDRKRAAALLASAHERELAASTGPRGYGVAGSIGRRRGKKASATPPIDDLAYISHDPVISILQSALVEYFLTQAPDKIEKPKAASTGRRRDAASFAPVGAPSLKSVSAQPRRGRRLFNRYSETDPRWIASVVAMGVRALKKPHAFNTAPATPWPMGNRARLILVADWGSGLPRAQAVAKHMRAIVEEGKSAGIEQHVMHLGDVYYSGWEKEYRRNFLPYWPVKEGETGPLLRSWCLNGNHDMYSGGHAYYDYLLAEPRFAAQKKSSFFSLHNDHWDIFGLDTAHEDAGLRDPQLAWLQAKRQGSPRRSMLLSHHQLFSVYEKPSAPLQKKIGKYLIEQPVDVWFWGHEHRCVFYHESEGVKHARLIGHGGVPVYMNHAKDKPYTEPAFYQYREFKKTLFEKWAYFGFAIVDLDGPVARVRYIDEFGTKHAEEAL